MLLICILFYKEISATKYIKYLNIFSLCRHFICGRRTAPLVSAQDEDEDVASEHQRVASGAADSDILQVNQLTKVYQHLNKKVHAVKSLSVGIPAGEVGRHLQVPVSLIPHKRTMQIVQRKSLLA